MRELGSLQKAAVIFVPLCQSAEGKERRANLDWRLEICCTGSDNLHSGAYIVHPALVTPFHPLEI